MTATPSRWRDLGIRLASAAILAPLGLAAIYFGGAVWALLLAACAVGLGLEWSGLCGTPRYSWQNLSVAACLVVAGVADLAISPMAALGGLMAGAALVAVGARRLALGFGAVYIGLPYLSLLILRQGAHGFGDVLFVVLIVWAGDIGAYLIGRLVGGPRMAPTLSPGKTWSGALGGFCSAVLAGVATVAAFGPDEALIWPAILAGLLSIVAQGGDLFESAAKRHFGKKDSGNLIPGHGGLLDRLDGLLAAAPFAVAVSILNGTGLGLWN